MDPIEPFSWYAFAVDFQTAIVGLVGFIGVILTLIVNARIEAKASKRETKKRASAVVNIVEAELRLLLGAMLLGSDIEPDSEHSLIQFPRLKRRFSDSVMNELGVLDPELCRQIVVALSTVDNAMSKMRFVAEHETAEYIAIPSKNCETVSTMYATHSKVLSETLEAIEGYRRANA